MEQTKTSTRATDIDKHVGTRIRIRRNLLGLSTVDLAKAIGVTYQQANKYEVGKNRISAGRLYQIAKALDVPVEFFFEEIGEDSETGGAEVFSRQNLEMIRHLSAMPEPTAKGMRDMIRRVADGFTSQGSAA